MQTFPLVRKRPRRAGRRAGLTLLELVMVVSILAILTALVVPGMTDQSEETRKTVARATMLEVRDTIANRYLENMGEMPQPVLTGTGTDANRLAATLQVTGTSLTKLPQLQFLFVNPRQYDPVSATPYLAINDFDPQARIGWNGPYMMPKATTYPNPTARRFATDPNDTRTWADFGFTTTFGQTGDQTIMDPWGSPYVIIVRTVAHGSSTAYSAYVVSAGFNRKLDTTDDGTAGTGDDLLQKIKDWK